MHNIATHSQNPIDNRINFQPIKYLKYEYIEIVHIHRFVN